LLNLKDISILKTKRYPLSFPKELYWSKSMIRQLFVGRKYKDRKTGIQRIRG
jgi:hypothetical protein